MRSRSGNFPPTRTANSIFRHRFNPPSLFDAQQMQKQGARSKLQTLRGSKEIDPRFCLKQKFFSSRARQNNNNGLQNLWGFFPLFLCFHHVVRHVVGSPLQNVYDAFCILFRNGIKYVIAEIKTLSMNVFDNLNILNKLNPFLTKDS